jgi:hypothetical protein
LLTLFIATEHLCDLRRTIIFKEVSTGKCKTNFFVTVQWCWVPSACPSFLFPQIDLDFVCAKEHTASVCMYL